MKKKGTVFHSKLGTEGTGHRSCKVSAMKCLNLALISEVTDNDCKCHVPSCFKKKKKKTISDISSCERMLSKVT